MFEARLPPRAQDGDFPAGMGGPQATRPDLRNIAIVPSSDQVVPARVTPFVIASAAKQTPSFRTGRLLRCARNDSRGRRLNLIGRRSDGGGIQHGCCNFRLLARSGSGHAGPDTVHDGIPPCGGPRLRSRHVVPVWRHSTRSPKPRVVKAWTPRVTGRAAVGGPDPHRSGAVRVMKMSCVNVWLNEFAMIYSMRGQQPVRALAICRGDNGSGKRAET